MLINIILDLIQATAPYTKYFLDYAINTKDAFDILRKNLDCPLINRIAFTNNKKRVCLPETKPISAPIQVSMPTSIIIEPSADTARLTAMAKGSRLLSNLRFIDAGMWVLIIIVQLATNASGWAYWNIACVVITALMAVGLRPGKDVTQYNQDKMGKNAWSNIYVSASASLWYARQLLNDDSYIMIPLILLELAIIIVALIVVSKMDKKARKRLMNNGKDIEPALEQKQIYTGGVLFAVLGRILFAIMLAVIFNVKMPPVIAIVFLSLAAVCGFVAAFYFHKSAKLGELLPEPPAKPKNSNLWIVVAAATCIVMLALTTLSLIVLAPYNTPIENSPSSNPSARPTESAPPANSSTLKTIVYRNEAEGFSFEYPEDWEAYNDRALREMSDAEQTYVAAFESAYGVLYISKTIDDGSFHTTNQDEFIDELTASLQSFHLINYSTIRLGDIPAIYIAYTYKDMGTTIYGKLYLYAVNGYIYVIVCGLPQEYTGEYLPVLNTIIDSYRITEFASTSGASTQSEPAISLIMADTLVSSWLYNAGFDEDYYTYWQEDDIILDGSAFYQFNLLSIGDSSVHHLTSILVNMETAELIAYDWVFDTHEPLGNWLLRNFAQ